MGLAASEVMTCVFERENGMKSDSPIIIIRLSAEVLFECQCRCPNAVDRNVNACIIAMSATPEGHVWQRKDLSVSELGTS